MSIRASTSAFALLAAMCLPSAVHAQDAAVPQGDDGQPDIVVTAQRRSEASRDVPISVTAISTAQLATANINQLSDTVKVTPGLRFDAQGPAVQPTIRGVGTAVSTSGGGPNVGIYVDGFFQANTYVSDFQLMKVQNIQVLKGPQGTLFGRNTTGGAILVTTADPSTETGGEFRVGFSRFNTIKSQGYVTFGLTDRIAMDLEGVYSYSDGFQYNTANPAENIGRSRSWSVRSGLKAELSDAVSVLLRYTHSEVNDPATQLVNAFVDKDGQAGFFNKVSAAGQTTYGRTNSVGLPLVNLNAVAAGAYATAPGQIALNTPVGFRAKSDSIQGTIKADLGFANLVSYTQYRHDHTPYYGDLDATSLQFFQINVDVVDKTFSQELLLTSKPGSPFQWTAGLNYFQIRDTWDVNASFGGSAFGDFGGSSTKTTSYAAFADVTYGLSDRFFVTVGARFSHDVVSDAYFKTNFTTTQYEGSNGETITTSALPETVIPVSNLKNDSLTPRIVLRYKPGQTSSVYASYTRGYKAGILNVGGLSAKPVEPEKINAFELGYKYDDRVLSFDLAGYYYDYKNLQVSSYQNGAAQIRNAASSEIYGVEGQFRYKLSRAITVNGGAAWTHARYKSFTNAPYYSYCDPAATTGAMLCTSGAGSLTQTTTDASGLHMQRAPDFTFNLGAAYGLDVAKGRLTLSGNLYHSGDFYFDPAEQFRQSAYDVVSLRAEWVDPSDHFSVAVFGDNVADKRYQTQVLFNTLGIGSVWNPPATYGVQFGAKF